MSTIVSEWRQAPPAPQDYLRNARQPDGRPLHPLLAQVLYARGIDDPGAFLYATQQDDLRTRIRPALIRDLEKGARRILKAVQSGEKICVYGDFDCDGVTATTLMVQVIRALGGDVMAYIPDRVDEGYGVNAPALRSLSEQGITLVVTVDCGIRSVQEVAEGLRWGLDIVITDHHSIGDELPDAFAVINPQRTDCDSHAHYGHLAGVGVAMMLGVQLMQMAGWPNGFRLSDILDLVAVGTVADIMHMNDPLNRLLVIHGLEVLNERRRVGFAELLGAAGIHDQVTAETIGFGIGPRINAAGRLDKGIRAYELLITDDPADARTLAKELDRLNAERQQRTRLAHERVRGLLAETGEIDAPLIFAQDDAIEAGIVGLVAGRLTEELYRPTVILHQEAHESRASCRSIPGFHITRALDACADLLSKHGGHAMAAGFTVPNENVPRLKERLLRAARDAMREQPPAPVRTFDAHLSLGQVSPALAEALRFLEPCGHLNPAPLFMSSRVRVISHRVLKERHLKLYVAEGSHPALDAIAFNRADFPVSTGCHVDLLYRLDINSYNGSRRVQLMVEDLRPAEVC